MMNPRHSRLLPAGLICFIQSFGNSFRKVYGIWGGVESARERRTPDSPLLVGNRKALHRTQRSAKQGRGNSCYVLKSVVSISYTSCVIPNNLHPSLGLGVSVSILTPRKLGHRKVKYLQKVMKLVRGKGWVITQ